MDDEESEDGEYCLTPRRWHPLALVRSFLLFAEYVTAGLESAVNYLGDSVVEHEMFVHDQRDLADSVRSDLEQIPGTSE